MTSDVMRALLDSMKDPLVFVDTDHIIRYMNPVGIANYAKWGGAELIGKSVLDCHNEASQATIRQVFGEMIEGKEEHLISSNERRRIFMRAVRAGDGKLIGYYERYEWL